MPQKCTAHLIKSVLVNAFDLERREVSFLYHACDAGSRGRASLETPPDMTSLKKTAEALNSGRDTRNLVSSQLDNEKRSNAFSTLFF